MAHVLMMIILEVLESRVFDTALLIADKTDGLHKRQLIHTGLTSRQFIESSKTSQSAHLTLAPLSASSRLMSGSNFTLTLATSSELSVIYMVAINGLIVYAYSHRGETLALLAIDDDLPKYLKVTAKWYPIEGSIKPHISLMNTTALGNPCTAPEEQAPLLKLRAETTISYRVSIRFQSCSSVAVAVMQYIDYSLGEYCAQLKMVLLYHSWKDTGSIFLLHVAAGSVVDQCLERSDQSKSVSIAYWSRACPIANPNSICALSLIATNGSYRLVLQCKR